MGPDRIYLQWQREYHEETTWCVDQIDDDDIEYIRVDIADRRLALLREIADWYSATANAGFRYLPLDIVERLEDELADAADGCELDAECNG